MVQGVKSMWTGAVAAAVMALAAPVHAEVVFEFSNYSGISNRTPGFAPVSFISGVAEDINIDSIGVLNDLASDGDLRFLIIDQTSNQTVYQSEAQFFGDDGLSWKTSPSFLFTLLQGHQYLIGAIANVSATWVYDLETEQVEQNGITAEADNRNVSSFANPYVSGQGRTLIPLRLTGEIAPVPEPGALALMMAGLGVLGWAVRRRR